MVEKKEKNNSEFKIPKSKRKLQVVVIGSSDVICSKKAYRFAFEVGEELAKQGVITLTGGGLGVMEAALKGAKKRGGMTLAIIPWESIHKVNDYADVVVATGIGWSRNSINLNSCDGAIIVEGGAGTLNEATYAYMLDKPIVALTSSGGMAEEITNIYFDKRKTEFIYGSNTPKEAVCLLMKLIWNRRKRKEELTALDRDLLDTEEKQDWKTIIGKKKKSGFL